MEPFHFQRSFPDTYTRNGWLFARESEVKVYINVACFFSLKHTSHSSKNMVSTFNGINSGMTGKVLLETVYSNIFAKGALTQRDEVWSEEFATQVSPSTIFQEGPNAGQNNLDSEQWLFGNNLFFCTQTIIEGLVANGQVSTLPGCPTH